MRRKEAFTIPGFSPALFLLILSAMVPQASGQVLDEGGEPGQNAAEAAPIGEQISRHIMKLAEEERKNRLDFMHIVIDDITRLCELEKEQRDRLILAAKGAAERSMRRWNEQAERYFRSRVNGADPDTAKEILSNIGNVNFGGRGSDREGEAESLWTESLENILSDEQVETYEMVVAQRKQARIDAFSFMAIASLDNYLRLTPAQREELFPIVKQSATDHLEEIQRYWGDYLEQNMLMSLANAAEEKQLKDILSEKQFLRLRSATTNFEHFWEQRRRLRKAEALKEARQEEQKEARALPLREGLAPADRQAAIRWGAIFRRAVPLDRAVGGD